MAKKCLLRALVEIAGNSLSGVLGKVSQTVVSHGSHAATKLPEGGYWGMPQAAGCFWLPCTAGAWYWNSQLCMLQELDPGEAMHASEFAEPGTKPFSCNVSPVSSTNNAQLHTN